jgi:uncharacterized protein YegP (UPF0339 family)
MFWTEVYATKESARHAINVVVANAATALLYDRTT